MAMTEIEKRRTAMEEKLAAETNVEAASLLISSFTKSLYPAPALQPWGQQPNRQHCLQRAEYHRRMAAWFQAHPVMSEKPGL